jgi:hypothetical protein
MREISRILSKLLCLRHLSFALALSDLVPQVGELNVGTKLRDQTLLAVLADAPASVACEAYHIAGMVSEFE